MIKRWLLLLPLLLTSTIAVANHTDPPETVLLSGTFLNELGCPEDWMPDCSEMALTFDEVHQLWINTFEIPAGEHEYKVTINASWDENYGANGEQDGANITLSVTEAASVTFIYNPRTHIVTDSVNRIIANIPGSFNAAIGCPDTSFDDPGNPGDWAPDCWQTLLEDGDGDGIYTYVTNKIPPGDYEAKVAIGGNWSENYGDNGAPGGANLGFSVVKPNVDVLFTWDSESKIMQIAAEGAPKGNLKEQSAYWVAENLILTPEDGGDNQFTLYYAPNGGLEVTETGLSGGEAFELSVAEGPLPEEVRQKFPHLFQLTMLTLPEEALSRTDALLQGQLALAVSDANGEPVTATGIQIPGILDARYTYDGPLGVEFDAEGVPTFRVWAPTAQAVRLVGPQTVDMTRDDQFGLWSYRGDAGWPGAAYQYEVTVFVPSEGEVLTNLVTDPYSVGLTMNSAESLAIDLSSTALKPAGWEAVEKPPLDAFEDVILYELHVRDFSIADDSVPEAERGTFMAFTHAESQGMRHLQRLSDAGLTHVHLLPVFDIATINEDRSAQRAPIPRFLNNFEPNSDEQQQAIFNLRDEDGFNWGYDPFHYTVPEGSYATDPDGTARIDEFRQMVQALNASDLRVVMDVVYNHTNASGQSDQSVLDQIVPGYYHRLNSKGKVENSTCCANTATEHNMMRKLMIDSLFTWAVEYKVDGFRFDLMGHHMKADMLAVRAALDSLTLEEHGVNGKAILLYGEGWNFGEVASGARGVNATQQAMEGTGIGTFNDRLRDAVRGGNPFGGELEQGFGSGLLTNPNEANQESEAIMANRLTLMGDQIRVGLAGNMSDYTFVDRDGDETTGRLIDYNGSSTGYTADPQEVINYVSAHDNETLFDSLQFKLPLEADMATRVRYQLLSLSVPMFGQGIPFFHAGSEILRSKSMDRDSYNSGDWFNAIDWTYTENNWGRGLPVADKNEGKWELISPRLADPTLKPDQEAILATLNGFETLLQVRASSPLFRLRTAEEVQQRVRFYNTGSDQTPGLIVMEIDDRGENRIDPNYNRIVVIFNGRSEPIEYRADRLIASDMTLHPTLAASSGPIWAGAGYTDGTYTVPGVSAAVFIEPGDATVELGSEFASVASELALVAEGDEDGAVETEMADEASLLELEDDNMESTSSNTVLWSLMLCLVLPLILFVVGIALFSPVLTLFGREDQSE